MPSGGDAKQIEVRGHGDALLNAGTHATVDRECSVASRFSPGLHCAIIPPALRATDGEDAALKMLVIGSSDTGGASLADPSLAYPIVVGKELGAALGEPVEVVNLPVVHVGPKAVPRVVKALEEHAPDIVIFGYGPFSYVVGTVGQRVRRRYGARAYRLFHKMEVRFERATGGPDGEKPARVNHRGRWLARRIIGAEPPATKEEVTGIQVEILRQLSQREGLVVVLLHAPDLPPSVVRENKKANILLGEHRTYMTAVGRSHHFLIADVAEEFRAAASRESLSTSDGVHKSAAGHRIQADALLKTILSAPSPLARTGTSAGSGTT